MTELDARRRDAIARLRECDGVLVALSGGVDSAVLLTLALEALGKDRVLAVTGQSDSLPAHDRASAEETARRLGARHEILTTREMDRAAYRANAGDRCFHCRVELFSLLNELAKRRQLGCVVYGAIKEDGDDFRPGMRAALEGGVRAPLLEAGLTKAQIRALAREAGLSVAERPASACLASRIPAGTEVTPERLGQIEQAEAALRGLGFHQLRVRHHGDVARIELDPAGLARLSDGDLRGVVGRAVRAAGFRFVTIDVEGYRTGSLNPEPGGLQRIEPAREGGQ